MSAPSSSSVHHESGSNLPAVPLPAKNSPAERRAAALTIAVRCTDLADCRELLDMLGLLDEFPAGICARCGSTVPLRADGTLADHQELAKWDGLRTAPRACPHSGQRPAMPAASS